MKQSSKVLKFGASVVCVMALVGCYRQSYTVGTGGNTNKEAEYSEWESHWLAGLIGEAEVDVKAVCPSGNATVKSSHSFLNLVVNALIGIIYSPTTIEVYCDDSSSAQITLTPEQLRAAGQRKETMEMARRISAAKALELESALDAYRTAHRNIAGNGAPSTF